MVGIVHNCIPGSKTFSLAGKSLVGEFSLYSSDWVGGNDPLFLLFLLFLGVALVIFSKCVPLLFDGYCQLKFLSLPDTWMKEFFLAHIYTELQLIEEALQKYQSLIDAGFSKSTYIISQIAVAYHNIRGQ